MALRPEQIQARIETLTSSLPKAVEVGAGAGAQFSLLLSMITANQSLYPGEPQFSEEFSVDFNQSKPRIDEVYTGEIASRFTESLNNGERGEFAYLNSHVTDTVERPPYKHREVDHFSLVASMLADKPLVQTTA